MRIGLVSPYTWDVPGGVQAHVRDLAETLIGLGHDVSVLSPANDDSALPAYVVSSGRAAPVPYNGSVARISFGPVSATRTRRWIRDGDFDVLHLHEPLAPSLSVLALWSAKGPVVGTFHASVLRSRTLATLQPALAPAMEKIHARIAVSPAARRYIVEHMGGTCVLIPNGVAVSRFADAQPFDGWPGEGGAIGFLGRIDEPRKGLPVLLEAFEQLAAARPGLRLLVAGPGDVDDVRDEIAPALRDRVTLLGMVSEEDKPRVFRSVDVYCAPNTGGESFGIILLEAMASGAAIVASELDAFDRVLGGSGVLVPPEDSGALAVALGALLDDPKQRRVLSTAAMREVRRYDWESVARQVLAVYETVVGEKVRPQEGELPV